MPVMDGFEMLEHLSGANPPAIVMVTAYDQHAIRAFEAGAVDYLLKPIDQQRLIQAVERAKKMIGNALQLAESLAHLQEIVPGRRASSPKFRKIVGRLGEDYFLLNPDEVLAFQADGDITWISTPKLESDQNRGRYIGRRAVRSRHAKRYQTRRLSIQSSAEACQSHGLATPFCPQPQQHCGLSLHASDRHGVVRLPSASVPDLRQGRRFYHIGGPTFDDDPQEDPLGGLSLPAW
jgi:hypothetical protein